jgi:hypothetical protein
METNSRKPTIVMGLKDSLAILKVTKENPQKIIARMTRKYTPALGLLIRQP